MSATRDPALGARAKRDRTRALLCAAALPAALALGFFALRALELERASFEAERARAARGALEGAAARWAGRLELRLRGVVQRVREARAAGELEGLTPSELGGLRVLLVDGGGRQLWPPEAAWCELDRALEECSFALRQVLAGALPPEGEELEARELAQAVAAWERPSRERALARFRLAQSGSAEIALVPEDLPLLPSALRFAWHAARVRDAIARARADEVERELRALESFALPLRIAAENPLGTWLATLLGELEALGAEAPALRAAHERRAAAWREQLAELALVRAAAEGALARATDAGRSGALGSASAPWLALRWSEGERSFAALAWLGEEAQHAELRSLAQELEERTGAPALVARERAARASADELAAVLPGFGGELALLAAPRRGEAAFPWRTALAGAFLAGCFGLAFCGVALLARGVRRERRAVEEQSEFLSRVSHQLKTPVANLRLFAETLASGRASEPADVRRMQAILSLEAERLGDYLQRVLSLARLDETALAPAVEPIALPELVAAQRVRWEASAAQRALALRVALAPELPELAGDRRALEDALANVMENALRLTRAGGAVHLAAERSGATLLLRIEDEGPGIPAEERERIFERFAQLGGARRAAGEGSGLGLWIAREGARRAGGELFVERSDARGTAMLFRFPLPAEKI